ncbi:DUF6716 putative glycosyltransferase [Roseibium sp. SCPC15]|uniref:DUF6716 putative glycosyltransferase n=1 Tax=Roseibium sp. SCP15 TaxID=3141376 RepID=UPI00333A8184
MIGADSYVPHADAIASTFRTEGWKLELFIVSKEERPVVSERQLRRMAHSIDGLQLLSPQLLPTDKLFAPSFWQQFEAAFLGLHGTLAKKVLDLHKCQQRRNSKTPLTICCFPGVSYYLQTYGQWLRAGADIVLFNEPRTYKDYKRINRIFSNKPPDNSLIFGYPTLTNLDKKSDNNKSILYIDQNILPKGYKNRRNLTRKLFDLAEARPDATLRILARNKPTENSNHNAPDRTHIQFLVDEVRRTRKETSNIIVEYGPPREYLPEASLCIGITSTILLHSMYLGIPTVPLRIKGVRGEFNGFNLFQKSPMAMAIDDLISLKSIPALDHAWTCENILATDEIAKAQLRKFIICNLERRKTKSDTYLIYDLFPHLTKLAFSLVDFILHFRIGIRSFRA